MKPIKFIFFASTVIAMLAMAGCGPKIYLIDRPTLLEEEAAGEWPDLEKASEHSAVKNKPDSLSPDQMGRGADRTLQTLEGEPGLTVKNDQKPQTPQK